jgi:hypothetical protein
MARSQKTKKGNIPADDDFIEWMQERQGLEILDPSKEEDHALPFAAKLRYKGDKDADDSPWKIPPPGKRCNGKAYVRDVDGDYIVDLSNQRIMRPCYNWPMKGMTVCLFHGGGVKRVKRAAVERLVSALDAVSGALIKIALNENNDPKVRVQAINSIMDRVGVRGGTEVDLKDPGYLDVLRDLFSKGGEPTDEDE